MRKVRGLCDTQSFGGCECVDEKGYAAVHVVRPAMQDLESWWALKVPADCGQVLITRLLM